MGAEPARTLGLIKFGEDFELDTLSYRLCRSGQALKLERIPLELLLLLIEQRGQLVTRDQIIEGIWGSGVFLDTDNSINGAIRKLRRVLQDDPEQPRFIQTITGKGYRFIAEVTEAEPAAAPDSDKEFASPENPGFPALGPQTRRLAPLRWLSLAGIAACLLAVAWWQSPRALITPRFASVVAERPMLAVLPFDNLTGDAAQDYFSDGLTEEMISQLGNVDPAHLGVIGRTSVMHYKHTQEPLKKIAAELGVQYVIEGSVRRDVDRVRITAQLIQMKDQSHLWAREYDRDLSHLIALQAEIAQDVAREIQLTLADRPADAPRQAALAPSALEAYDLYLKGRYFWNKRTTPGFQQAIEYFQQAIAKDPSDARSYAGLADSYALLSGYSSIPQSETIPKARAAALKALQLDDRLAEAHTSLALITENYDWDWQKAEQEYRRAIALNPNYATAHQWYAECLALQGRFDEALAESGRARRLDPLSLVIATDNGMILYYARQYDRAIAQFRAVLEMEPRFDKAHMIIAAYIEKGQFTEALADFQKTARAENQPYLWAWRAYIFGRAGNTAEAQEALEKLQDLYRTQHIGPDAMLWAYIGMGKREESFAWLEKAYLDHSNSLTSLKVSPSFDWLRADPRFKQLMQRVHLSP
jgi:TolB-like protein/DNA-binding winged helix-turn-helix (wHTH) protein/Tfp pilus assembly protein PilF